MMQLLLSPTNNREKKVQDMFYVVVQAESKPFKKEVAAWLMVMVIWQEARAVGVQVAWCTATSFEKLFTSFMCFTLLAIDKESELSKDSGTDVFLSDRLFQ